MSRPYFFIMKHLYVALIAFMSIMYVSLGCSASRQNTRHAVPKNHAVEKNDTIHEAAEGKKTDHETIHRLTEQDYKEVAEELGIEIATIKAVVEIEAGPGHEGFYKPGLPIINFDMSMFRRFAGKNGINLSKYNKSHAVVFSRPNASRYGSTQGAQQARFKAARTIDETTAIQGCFWGMFQIGGFNWRKTGCSTIQEFLQKMSLSEREQLELFARFITNSGMLKHLQNKNWASFAKMYNGNSYARRGYHTRLANSYAKHKRSGN